MKNQIISVTRYARPTVYGIILVFTVEYSSGKSRRWILKDNPYGYWHGSWSCKSPEFPSDQRCFLPRSVSSFISGFDYPRSFYDKSDAFYTIWG